MFQNEPSALLFSLLKDSSRAESFALALEEAMLSMVLILNYEPENLRSTLCYYENLHILKNLIRNREMEHMDNLLNHPN